LPRSRKVRRHADFQRIQSSSSRDPGKAEKAHVGRATSAHFVFLVARTVGALDAPSRLGLVVTKKIGCAVERNRVKRVCRECFRLWPDFVPAGIDLIVIARQGAPRLGLAEVRDEWTRARGALRHRSREALAQTPTEPHVSARKPEDPS
jgi:ribonuclease P protein component